MTINKTRKPYGFNRQAYIVVNRWPLGLPHFWITGGIVIPKPIKEKTDNSMSK